MRKIKKVSNNKILALLITVTFLLTSTVYGVDLPFKNSSKDIHIRVPMGKGLERQKETLTRYTDRPLQIKTGHNHWRKKPEAILTIFIGVGALASIVLLSTFNSEQLKMRSQSIAQKDSSSIPDSLFIQRQPLGIRIVPLPGHVINFKPGFWNFRYLAEQALIKQLFDLWDWQTRMDLMDWKESGKEWTAHGGDWPFNQEFGGYLQINLGDGSATTKIWLNAGEKQVELDVIPDEVLDGYQGYGIHSHPKDPERKAQNFTSYKDLVFFMLRNIEGFIIVSEEGALVLEKLPTHDTRILEERARVMDGEVPISILERDWPGFCKALEEDLGLEVRFWTRTSYWNKNGDDNNTPILKYQTGPLLKVEAPVETKRGKQQTVPNRKKPEIKINIDTIGKNPAVYEDNFRSMRSDI